MKERSIVDIGALAVQERIDRENAKRLEALDSIYAKTEKGLEDAMARSEEYIIKRQIEIERETGIPIVSKALDEVEAELGIISTKKSEIDDDDIAFDLL